jgi:hypothetical protein
MRIVKDYSNRGRKSAVNIAPSTIVDEAKISANAGGARSKKEAMIAHETASNQRAQRQRVPANTKLGKKR